MASDKRRESDAAAMPCLDSLDSRRRAAATMGMMGLYLHAVLHF